MTSFVVHLVLVLAAVGPGQSDRAHTLNEQVEAFFRTDSAKTRAALRSSIEREAQGNTALVASAIRDARLWGDLPDPVGSFRFDDGSSPGLAISYRLPDRYDPAAAHPLVFCMPGEHTVARDSLDRARRTLGRQADTYAFVAPSRPIGSRFHERVDPASDLPRLMREIRRRIHVDTDRVFLFGAGEGGDAAWIAATSHADLFAGVIVLSGYLRVPYPEQVYPFLLHNLRDVPVLCVWTTAEGAQTGVRARAVAAHNRALVSIAKRESLPIVGVESSGGGPMVMTVPPERLSTVLRHRRPRAPRVVTHWFRFPSQGSAAWMRQRRFRGDPWEGDQLSILPRAKGDRDALIANVVKAQMAYLGGRVDGQTITIEAQRCARVQLLLPPDLLDLRRPITVRCNGKKRFEGPAHPSIATMLHTAYETWEFQRLAVASVSFSIRPSSRRQ